jgi:hypothetical protein
VKNRTLNIRQAITLALVGWYLMSPPSGMSESNKFSDWDIVKSYDSAAECRKAQIEDLKNAESAAASKMGDNLANRDKAEATLMAKAAKCIATDHPRLEEK